MYITVALLYQKIQHFLKNHKDIVVVLINAIQPFIND